MKVNNYLNKVTQYEAWKKRANPEDVEFCEIDIELGRDLFKTHFEVERIFCRRKNDEDQIEFYVKWRNLSYSEATWEAESLIKTHYLADYERFKRRKKARTEPKDYRSSMRGVKVKFSPMKKQPDYIGSGSLRLRDYQLDGISFLLSAWCRGNSVILADEMGLGKTIQTVCFLKYLFHNFPFKGPMLVCVPLSTVAAWQKELSQWAPDMNTVTYLGDAKSRDVIREFECENEDGELSFNVLLCSYEMVCRDRDFFQDIIWSNIVVDEAHRLKNEESLLYKVLTDIDSHHRLLLTGTPLQNNLKELWCLLNYLKLSDIEDWSSFEQQYGKPEDVANGYIGLHTLLKPYIIRRLKKDVEKSLPPKVEQILRVEMTRKQKNMYKMVLTKNYHFLSKGGKSQVSLVNIMMQLRKTTNHVELIHEPDPDEQISPEERLKNLNNGSGKMLLLDKLLTRFRAMGDRVLIFSQMVIMLNLIEEYLQLKRFPYQRLDGSVNSEKRKQAIASFNAPESADFCFLLSTKAGGLGINLQTANRVIIYDSDFNPQNDLQAIARAHRIGQKEEVKIFRLVASSSVDEDIIQKAKNKMVLDHLVIQRMDTSGRTVLGAAGGSDKNGQPFSKEELSSILKFGAEELFKEDEDKDDAKDEPACDIDEILRRAETRAEEQTEDDDDLMSGFKVASFSVDEDSAVASAKSGGIQKLWDEIIPTKIRDELVEEERQKELAELYLGPRQRKTVLGGENKENENKRKREGQSDEEADNEASQKKKKKDEKVKGFTDGEIRRFIKSYKKFPMPLTRMEDIAEDADLTEKSVQDLLDLGRLLRQKCVESLEQESESSKKVESVKLGKVSINPKTLVEAESLLRPLGKLMPQTEDERKAWRVDVHLKEAHFDVAWAVEEDSKLLVGIYLHGLGSWEQIKSDKSLELNGKILLNASCKPQEKHLDVRAAYLLRMLKRKTQDGKEKEKAPQKKKTVAATEEKETEDDPTKQFKSKELVEDEGSSEDDKKKKDKKSKKKDGKKKGKAKASSAPVHIGSSELSLKSDLDSETFAQCKEKMRAVKKSLTALDKPDPNQTQEEQVSGSLIINQFVYILIIRWPTRGDV